jgi:low affinity Fe/Cu permease
MATDPVVTISRLLSFITLNPHRIGWRISARATKDVDRCPTTLPRDSRVQNRDARAIHLKLDELIRGMNGARNRLIDLEVMSEEELDDLQRQFVKLRRQQ